MSTPSTPDIPDQTLTVPPVPPPLQTDPPGAHQRKGAVEGSATWSLTDRIGLAICWALGLLFCAIAVAIVAYLMVQGIKFLRPEMLWTPAAAGFSETETGGFSDAFIGNHLVTEGQKASVAGVSAGTGDSLMAAVLVLTLMIAPLMVSIFSEGLRSVKPGWME
jgi:ABC-type phosphate transport system permease subunit